MHLVRRKLGLASSIMAMVMIMIAVPVQPILAAMIPTGSVQAGIEAAEARRDLKTLLAREEVREALISHGIDPHEAMTRIEAMTDAEALAAADRLENLPAGGSAVGVVVGALLVVFLVLLITDILGYTDIFPFVK